MLGIILFAITIFANFILVCVNRKSKLVLLISVIILGLLAAYSKSDSGDLLVYKNAYYFNYHRVDTWGIGYVALEWFCNNIGLSFEGFRLLIFFISVLFLYLSIKDYVKNVHLILVLYSISFYYFLAIVLRFNIAFALAIYALHFLLKSGKLYWKVIRYLITIFIAALFHISVLFYLVALLFLLPSKLFKIYNLMLYLINTVSLIILFAILIRPQVGTAIGEIIIKINPFDIFDQILYSYWKSINARIFTIYGIVFMINHFFLNRSIRMINDKEKGLTDLVHFLSLSCMPLFPMLLLSDTTMRLFFIPVFLSFIIYQIAIEFNKNNKQLVLGRIKFNRAVRVSFTTLVVFLWFITIYVRHAFNFDFASFLSNNIIFS